MPDWDLVCGMASDRMDSIEYESDGWSASMVMNGREPGSNTQSAGKRKVDDRLLTFDQWKEEGRVVVKGEKAQWVDGVAKFARKQTTRVPIKLFKSNV